MAILNQKRILNLIPKTSAPVTIHVSQGDVGTEIEFTLVKGDELFVNTGSLTASVHGVREDGANFGAFACTLSGSSVKFPLHSEMTMVKGSAIAEIVLVDSQGNKVGSANFGIMVEESVFPLGVTYDNDVSVYESILDYVQTIPAQVTQDYNTKIGALNEALASESGTRAAADTALGARIDQIIAPSGEAPSAAEVTDARIGANGVTYNSLGLAIRSQIDTLDDAITKEHRTLIENIEDGIYTHEGFLQANGTFADTSAYVCGVTQLIRCKEGDVFYYKGIGSASAISALFYKNDKIISSEKYASGTDYTTVTIPQGIDGVVFSSYASNIQSLAFSVKKDYPSIKELSNNNEISTIDYDNIEHVTSLIADKFLNAPDGRVIDNASGAAITDFIDLDGIKYLTAGGRTLYSAAGCIIYDKDKNFVKTLIGAVSPWTIHLDVKKLRKEYPIVKYIRFGTLYESTYPLTVYIYRDNAFVDVPQVKSKLTQKTYYALGDSYTHGSWLNTEDHPNWEQDPEFYDASVLSYKTYAYWIAQRNNMELHNISGNGNKLIDDIVGRNLYKEVPSNADYCTLMIGLNDATINNPIGDIDVTDTTTFYGCLNTVMSYYRTNNPDMHFAILVLPNLKEAYRTALINAAIKYGYPYLDMYNDPKVPAFMAIPGYAAKAGMDISISTAVTNHNMVEENNYHPSLEAHKKMSMWVEEFIKEI